MASAMISREARQDEAEAAEQGARGAPQPPCAVDRDLRRRRPRQDVRHRHRALEVARAHPALALDAQRPQHRDVRRRPAEAGYADPQPGARDLAKDMSAVFHGRRVRRDAAVDGARLADDVRARAARRDQQSPTSRPSSSALLQGVTELFPISSLGHTVLCPDALRLGGLVKSQSRPESYLAGIRRHAPRRKRGRHPHLLLARVRRDRQGLLPDVSPRAGSRRRTSGWRG